MKIEEIKEIFEKLGIKYNDYKHDDFFENFEETDNDFFYQYGRPLRKGEHITIKTNLD
jgi:hypothetical protein